MGRGELQRTSLQKSDSLNRRGTHAYVSLLSLPSSWTAAAAAAWYSENFHSSAGMQYSSSAMAAKSAGAKDDMAMIALRAIIRGPSGISNLRNEARFKEEACICDVDERKQRARPGAVPTMRSVPARWPNCPAVFAGRGAHCRLLLRRCRPPTT